MKLWQYFAMALAVAVGIFGGGLGLYAVGVFDDDEREPIVIEQEVAPALDCNPNLAPWVEGGCR